MHIHSLARGSHCRFLLRVAIVSALFFLPFAAHAAVGAACTANRPECGAFVPCGAGETCEFPGVGGCNGSCIAAAGGGAACTNKGAACGGASTCCFSLVCNAGGDEGLGAVCRTCGQLGGANGTSCTGNEDCCPGLTCHATNKVCGSGAGDKTCIDLTPCSTDADCNTGTGDNTCTCRDTNGVPIACPGDCKAAGTACASAGECCSGSICSGGLCRQCSPMLGGGFGTMCGTSTQKTCIDLTPCASDADCNTGTGDDTCACRDGNGITIACAAAGNDGLCCPGMMCLACGKCGFAQADCDAQVGPPGAPGEIKLIEPLWSSPTVDANGDPYAMVPIKPGWGTFMYYLMKSFNWIIEVAVGIVIIWMLIGGFQYMISGNNQTARSEAVNRITWAVLGLLLLLFSGVILRTLNSMFFVP